MFEVGGATFTKMAITRERNEIFSPNLAHTCKSSFCGRVKRMWRLATWWSYNMEKKEKLKNGYNYAT